MMNPVPPPPLGRANSFGHRPLQPSGLRQEYTLSSSPPSIPDSTTPDPSAVAAPNDPAVPGPSGSNSSGVAPTETTALLHSRAAGDRVDPDPKDHGTFSPRAASPEDAWLEGGGLPPSEDSSTGGAGSAAGSTYGGGASSSGGGRWSGGDNWRTKLAKRVKSKKMSQSSALAERAGFEDSLVMYLAYYIPCLTWMRQYTLSHLKGDLIASLTMASMYLPMSLSLADNLAHVSPIHGLYSFVVHPFLYALLGSCTAMVVGPEAPGSLLVGTVVKAAVDAVHDGGDDVDDDVEMQSQIAGVVTGLAGATVLLAGLSRLGFLDNVLSRPFLRGFISAIGVVVMVEQLVPELGLVEAAEELGVSHGSAVEKIGFIFQNTDKIHTLTFAVAAVSFGIIMICRELKNHLQPRYPSVAYFPDRFLVVVVSAILSYRQDWSSQGVQILGAIDVPAGGVFHFRWPFRQSNMGRIRDSLSTSFLIALLGFFESSVAAKSLGQSEGGVQGIDLSANRELVALGVSNLVGGCFMSLPAFGGYGRSKVNRATGGRTPMSSIFLSCLGLLCIMFALPLFYHIPKPVLCSLISVVGWSLVEEAPHDILFFTLIRAWAELGLMAVIFVATMFYSLTLGMAIGVGLSILRVVYHATRSRIQILGRIPGTDRFENAELDNGRPWAGLTPEEAMQRERERPEFVEGCLIVKIPEPLTFANTGELRSRLRRLERYGTSAAHPALPRLRGEDCNRNVIFDIHGVTSLDGAGAQVLEEIVRGYRERGVRVFFSHVPGLRPPRDGGSGSINGDAKQHPVLMLMQRAGIVDLAGGEAHFVHDVHEALKLTETEDAEVAASQA